MAHKNPHPAGHKVWLPYVWIGLGVLVSSRIWAGAALVNWGAVKCGNPSVAHHTLDFILLNQPLAPAVTADCCLALSDFEIAQRLNPNSTRSLFWIGYARLARGDLATAALAFDRSTALEPGNGDAWLFSGLTYDRLGQGEAAVSRWQGIRDSALAVTALADRLIGYQDCLGAERYYRIAIREVPPGLERAHLGLADCLDQQGYFEEAVGEYQTAFQLGLKDDVAANRLGKLLIQLDRPQEAIPWLTRALEWHLYPWHMVDLAKGYEAAGDHATAEYWLTETERQFPKTLLGYWELGNFYLRSGQYQKAITHFERAVMIDPACPYYCYSDLGRAYVAANCPYEAVEAFAEALRRDPANTVVAQWLKNAETMSTPTAEKCP